MRVVELFSGAGGMSLGLQQAGFEILRAYDAWPVAVENYNRNIGNHAVIADLKDLLSIVPEILSLTPDLICGGPPCQDYSSAGNRKEADNARLTMAFAMIVSIVKPQWFMMENVIGCAKSATWREARMLLKRAGYGFTESRINASHYGVPQSRRRLFVIGRIGERDDFLASSIAAAAQPSMTLRDLFGVVTPAAIYFPATSEARRSIWGPDEPAPTIRERSIRPIPASYQPHPDDSALILNGFVYSRPFRAGRGVRSIDEPFPTVTRTVWERPTSRYLSSPHPDDPVAAAETAVLKVHQISRIQGFPASWEWRASAKQDILQMIANAVPAPVATALGRVILDRESGKTTPEIAGGFLQWLVKRGRSKASARNVKASAGRARRILGGRTFDNLALEIATLESHQEFHEMRKPTQSDLRQALRILAEYQTSSGRLQKKPQQATAQPLIGLADAA
ncbi:DNA cytosine methyltransferase [Neorhizobium sp. T786]|uniref:DNA cytosine methyltransferase n=1 Tax=Pseudorhizobium xiangyangii TaxID=2883104 RepID=UPI001CFFF0BA|nr:DNA cytosine methyltransferase [Neorhizobium xiangyangii]MCB5204439.1 DNA cytosine methyltransferase [Neorhizobium xiangyangii]